MPKSYVPEKLEFLGNLSPKQFRKNSLLVVFQLFCHLMHDYAKKSSTFKKLGEFLPKYGNFSEFSALNTPNYYLINL